MKVKGILAGFVFIIAGIAFAASSEPKEPPCGVIVKFGIGTQIIPPQGKVQTRFENDQPVACGSMIVTHSDALWIRHSNLTVFKIGAHSFFELGKEKSNAHRLDRGSLLVTAPRGVPMTTLSTPNGEVEFDGGVAWVEYAPDQKETSAAAFSRSFTFRNKFNAEASQDVHAGEISRLAVNQERIVPSQPEVMNPTSVKEALSGFGLAADESQSMQNVVERVFALRAKSLTTDIEDWDEIERSVETDQRSDRQIASVPDGKNVRNAIDPKEAKHTMELLKEHLYGSAADLKMLDDDDGLTPKASSRSPASKTGGKLVDPEYERIQKKKKRETQRLIHEVSNLK